ncbi:cytochrome P450 [Sphaerisporangium sp. TRM90804]|uniref:cytochrome P450 n=1 Tax=Sphaerisporangium sp. TRM90804 TaxID=3031113 RepID=UPI00244BC84A|nr:cytochrome P450 [Sphaerisporangium sp. TRM90804]MDH2427164.1 cytochrome P450 [Sphaerisporangium sp. TRM90804]
MTDSEWHQVRREPYDVYAEARETPGLTYLPELDSWLVSRFGDAREVLRRPEVFSSARALRADVVPGGAALAELRRGVGGARTVVTADGEEHRRYRLPLTRGFSAARVAAVVPFIAERAEALVDGFTAGGPGGPGAGLGGSGGGAGRVELMGDFAEVLAGEVVGRVMGLDTADVPLAVGWSRRAVDLLFVPLEEEEQVRAARDVVALQHLLDGYARRRREQPRDDVCTEMVRALAPGSGEMSAEQRAEVVSNLQNLLLAGHLTTTALIGTAVLHLLRHREQWELLRARPAMIPAAVEEAVRHDTALQAFHRVTTRPVTLAGTQLAAGASVLVAFGSANRDEARFERADVFDITRAPVRHMGFGHGAHACPGAQLAREQVRIALETLTRRLPGLRLAPGHTVLMRSTMIHRSPEQLVLTW